MTVDLTSPPYADLVAGLAKAGRRAVSAGLVIGSGGNLSARLPGGDTAVVTGAGTWLDELDPDSFSAIRLPGGEVLGGNPTPTTEVALHLECYRARPDINAIIHLHPQMAVLLTALGHPIRLITTDHTFYVRDVGVSPYFHNGTPELATSAATLIGNGLNCVVLSNHGCSVVADSIELAYKRAANLEEAARATYHALLLGDTDTVAPASYRERLAHLDAGIDTGLLQPHAH